MMAIEVVRPGLLTSIQDLGRPGWQRYGIPVGGAMDPVALRVANMLVGNKPNDAVLEITLMGPTLRFLDDAIIAVCGGDLCLQIDGAQVPAWRPLWIKAGSEIRFGSAVRGCRAYLAVDGGFDVPEILGSRSTYFQASIGGLDGRAIRAGDFLHIRPSASAAMGLSPAQTVAPNSCLTTSWQVDPTIVAYADNPTIRVCPGRHRDRFDDAMVARFFTDEFEVTNRSDRMGYRLAGPMLASKCKEEILSEAVTAGTIQVPPNGQPIALMADCPVTGGYPKIAQVAAVDLPVLAQLKPGAKVRFQDISVLQAAALYRDREHSLEKLRCAIQLKRLRADNNSAREFTSIEPVHCNG